jgi:hypothetical protein
MLGPKRVLLVVLLVAAGCGGADTSEGGTNSQPAPADTVADAGTAVSTDTTIDEVDIFTVTQAEDGCTVSGPTEVPAGQIYYFIVKNPYPLRADLYVSRLTDGKTFPDLLEPQTSPGAYYPKPSWVVYAKSEPVQAREFSRATELADDERVEAFSVDPGPHAIYTSIGQKLWFCAPLQVT